MLGGCGAGCGQGGRRAGGSPVFGESPFFWLPEGFGEEGGIKELI